MTATAHASAQTPYLRLRQVCLVAPALAPAVAAVQTIFGLPVCYRDPNVAKFGLENALFALGNSFLEIVAPTQTGTAAGRFLDRSQGVGGYMLIFDCDNPAARRQRAEGLGVRLAFALDYPDYRGIQLHPRDSRAAILEFDHTDGGQALDGPYHPAGATWQTGRRPALVQGLALAEVATPDPVDLARHWSALMDWPATADASKPGSQRFDFDFGAVRIVPAAPDTAEHISALHLQVSDPAAVLAAAAQHGCVLQGQRFMLAGVWVQAVALQATAGV